MQLAMAGGQSVAMQTVAMQAAAANGPAALLADGGGFWICSPSGPRLVEPDDAGDRSEAPRATGHCYWCQGFGSAPAPGLPPAAVPPGPVIAGHGLGFWETPERVRRLRVAAFQSRAPPLLRAV